MGCCLSWGCVCTELHCFKALKSLCLYLFLLQIYFKNRSGAFCPDLNLISLGNDVSVTSREEWCLTEGAALVLYLLVLLCADLEWLLCQ